MNRVLSYIATVVVSVALTLVGDMTVRGSKASLLVVDRATSAAFRDGRYQAKLDVEDGRNPHFSSARWSTDQDRASYISGYEQAYPQFLAATGRKMTPPGPADLDGYRDGISDATSDRKSPLRFRLAKTDHYRTASLGLAASDPISGMYWHSYQQAYSNGYQKGYYSERKHLESPTLSAPVNPF